MNIKSLTKNQKVLGLVLIFGLLVFAVQSYSLGTINLGFEGPKVTFFGVHFNNWEGYEGGDQFHAYHDTDDPILYKAHYNILGQLISEERVYWSSPATPNDAGIGWHQWEYPLSPKERERPCLGIHVEQNPKLEKINRQGDPLNWSKDNPLEGRRIEYCSLDRVKKTETDNEVIYEYTLTKESFLIAPAEFWVGFYLDAAQEDAATGSGWREGEWQGITMWFRMGFHVWNNAYYGEWLDDPQVYTTETGEIKEIYSGDFGGKIISQDRLVPPQNYRGGFPIAGWIQGWEKADQTSNLEAGEQQSPIWYDVKKGIEVDKRYTEDQLSNLRNILNEKVSFSPDMVGQFISLYDEPEVQFSYDEPDVQANYTAFNNVDEKNSDKGLTGQLKTPDSAMKETMYFPINVQNFGTYAAEEQGFLQGWTVYYPSAYFRIRMIYGVRGTFKYLWTEEILKDKNINYPNTTERHGTTVIHTSGPLTPFADFGSGVAGWFSNPFNQLWTFFIIMVIVLVAVTVLNPGLWASLALSYKSTKSSGFRRKKG